jgi:hypothetical protein
MFLTCLPRRVSQCLRVLGPCFRHRHRLVFSWLLVFNSSLGSRPTSRRWPIMARCISPTTTAGGCCMRPTGRRRRYTLKGKRGPNHPVAQKTRLSQHHPYVFGFRIVVRSSRAQARAV